MIPLHVCHFLDAGDAQLLWGKERVVQELMQAQRSSGEIEPRLIVFTSTLLSEMVAADGFRVDILEERHAAVPYRSLPRLMRLIAADPGLVMHTHGYKANVVARLARQLGAPSGRLISTCHGWIDETLNTRLYNKLDRLTGAWSDIITAPNRQMLAKFGRCTRTAYIPNAVADRPVASSSDRRVARTAFGWHDQEFIVGSLGRLDRVKGALNYLQAAASAKDWPIFWAAAGAGPLEAEYRGATLSSLRFVGYVYPPDQYLAAIDVFVQPSVSEGLSLALLEAMRAGKPIVATRAGGTDAAITDDVDGLLVDVEDPDALGAAVVRLFQNRQLAARLGAAARARFEREFRIERQHRAFHQLYVIPAESKASIATVQ